MQNTVVVVTFGAIKYIFLLFPQHTKAPMVGTDLPGWSRISPSPPGPCRGAVAELQGHPNHCCLPKWLLNLWAPADELGTVWAWKYLLHHWGCLGWQELTGLSPQQCWTVSNRILMRRGKKKKQVIRGPLIQSHRNHHYNPRVPYKLFQRCINLLN